MKKFMVPAALLAAVLMMPSCDKNNDAPAITLGQIQAKWNVTSLNFKYGPLDSTYNGIAADYFDFRTDGKVYTSLDGENDTTAYSLISNNRLVFEGDTATIKTLNNSQFVFEADTVLETVPVKTTFSLNK